MCLSKPDIPKPPAPPPPPPPPANPTALKAQPAPTSVNTETLPKTRIGKASLTIPLGGMSGSSGLGM